MATPQFFRCDYCGNNHVSAVPIVCVGCSDKYCDGACARAMGRQIKGDWVCRICDTDLSDEARSAGLEQAAANYPGVPAGLTGMDAVKAASDLQMAEWEARRKAGE